MHTSLKPKLTDNSILKEIIASWRKDVRNRIQVVWKKLDIIINNAWEKLYNLERLTKVILWLSSPHKIQYIKDNLEHIFNVLIKHQESIDSEEDMVAYKKLVSIIISSIETWELNKNTNYAEAKSKWVAKRHGHAGHIVKYQKRVISKQEWKVRTYRVDMQNKSLELETLEMMPWKDQGRWLDWLERSQYPTPHLENTK